jgi:BT1 family
MGTKPKDHSHHSKGRALGSSIFNWIDANILELGRELRLSYLPPLMIYLAAGISGLTGIVSTFFVKEYLGLSAEFLAMLGFWAGLAWAIKMPLGHLVDLLWRWKAGFVFLGAGLISASLAIMLGLLGSPELMRGIMPMESWFVISVLLAPVGYVLQDVVADAMTVEAVPVVDHEGHPFDDQRIRLMHTTMQTLGRVAIIGGSIAVSLVNLIRFADIQHMAEADRVLAYLDIYRMALLIPVVSILGVGLAAILKRRQVKQWLATGIDRKQIDQMLATDQPSPQPNWWILGGSGVFVVFTMMMGLGDVRYGQELVFGGSLTIILFLISRLVKVLEPEARRMLVGTALIIFVFRAVPLPGEGAVWFQIDELGFDQRFLSVLALIANCLTLFGMFIFRRFMAEKSIAYVIVFLTLAGTILSLPNLGLYYGLHRWTASLTGGVVDAHFIAIINTALESPLGQIAMIPMLAWIAQSAPAKLKATFFAIMASFTNLALSASQLGTQYLNQIFIITREVKNPATGIITIPADYSDLGILLITVIVLGLVLPILAVGLVRASHVPSR